MPITIKIDCTKIDKKRLYAGRNGAQYLDAVLIETPDGKYDQDYMIVQSVSVEERKAGTRGAILGNGKLMGKWKPAKPAGNESDEGIPF